MAAKQGDAFDSKGGKLHAMQRKRTADFLHSTQGKPAELISGAHEKPLSGFGSCCGMNGGVSALFRSL